MLKRFLTKMVFFKTFKQFSPSVCCNPMDHPSFCSIAKILNPVLKVNIPIGFYEKLWRKMPFVKWSDCLEDSGQNLNVFLSNVCCGEDSAGYKQFKKLAELVFNILCMLTKNAWVERVF